MGFRILDPAAQRPTSSPPVQSVVRALRLLELLAEAAGEAADGVGVLELARRARLSPSTAHRLLATLVGEGYASHDGSDSRYRLGTRLYALAGAAEPPLELLRERIRPAMERLQRAHRETVNLSVLDGRHVIYVFQVESDRAVRAFNRTGNRILAHASGAGKALLAHQRPAVLESLLDSPLQALTKATITDPELLHAELELVRRRGYAFDLGEQDDEVVCVAAAIYSPGGRALAALSISGPSARMRAADLDAIGADLAAATRVPSRA